MNLKRQNQEHVNNITKGKEKRRDRARKKRIRQYSLTDSRKKSVNEKIQKKKTNTNDSWQETTHKTYVYNVTNKIMVENKTLELIH